MFNVLSSHKQRKLPRKSRKSTLYGNRGAARNFGERKKGCGKQRAKEKAREREESSATEVESTRCRDFIWCSAGRNLRRLFSSRPFFLPSPCLFFAFSFTLLSLGRRVHNAAALITPYMHNKDKKLGVSNSDARHARRLPNRVIHGASNDPTQVATSEISLSPAPLPACPLSPHHARINHDNFATVSPPSFSSFSSSREYRLIMCKYMGK